MENGTCNILSKIFNPLARARSSSFLTLVGNIDIFAVHFLDCACISKRHIS